MHLIDSSGIDLDWASSVIDSVQDVPTYIADIRGGSHVDMPKELNWMKFNLTDKAYEVSFLHNVWKRDPEFVNQICTHFQLKLGIKFSPMHFMLIRTLSDSSVHRDYGPEKCRINIGLRGSELSTTILHDLDREVQMKDGESWLFDPTLKHSVRANNEEGHRTYRYLGSLFIFHPYELVLSRLGGDYSSESSRWTNLPNVDCDGRIPLIR
jgi:hypothetical protein